MIRYLEVISVAKEKNKRLIWPLLGGLLWFLGWFILLGCRWYDRSYSTGFTEMLYTMAGGLGGAGEEAYRDFFLHCAMPVIGMVGLYAAMVILLTQNQIALKIWGKRLKNPSLFLHRVSCLGMTFCVLLLPLSLIKADMQLQIIDYFRARSTPTMLYEEEYADPDLVALKTPAQKKNLIWLYLESMETTYAFEYEEDRTVNYMPELTALARENLFFSESVEIGGFRSLKGTNWTMAAILASTAGIPFSFPVDGNGMSEREAFAPGLISLGDILEQAGYTQVFMCGSDAAYGGRKHYYRDHGNFEIYDLFEARSRGDLPSDYYVWWGFEDHHLFEFAKKELTRIAAKDQPFHLSLLTVDAHHPGGFRCDWCRDDYVNPTGNVIACTDRQVRQFVSWCENQPWWDHTVMVITGDHPRMDSSLVGDTDIEERPVYNCFLNTGKPKDHTAGRLFSTMDLFPTVLSALGYEIPGNRLGLGTNLFSGENTLLERKGIEWVSHEISCFSDFYMRRFVAGSSQWNQQAGKQ